jgi:CelD/BcsL family acetyltransferase involved in cellulose biosynthesis
MIRNLQSASSQSSESVKLSVVAADQIDSRLQEAWNRMRTGNPLLVSPYFDVDFTKAVARCRNDVQIAFSECDGTIDQIFPFQSLGNNRIGPVGGLLNDVHGVICDRNFSPDLLGLMASEFGYSGIGFHAALTGGQGDSDIEKFSFKKINSYHLDLADGWAAYRKWVRKSSSTIARQGQKTRRLEKDFGSIRFEFDVQDRQILERLVQLKRAKYQRSRTFDILSVDWAANLLREIAVIKKPNFRGILSALWAGEELVGVHFGMLTDDILHYWFPVFDPAFSRYSPGTELLLRSAEAASEIGVTKLDLGYGDDPYKLKFSNGTETLACGRISSTQLAFQIAKRKHALRHKLKGIPLKPLAKVMLRSVFPGYGGWNYK